MMEMAAEARLIRDDKQRGLAVCDVRRMDSRRCMVRTSGNTDVSNVSKLHERVLRAGRVLPTQTVQSISEQNIGKDGISAMISRRVHYDRRKVMCMEG